MDTDEKLSYARGLCAGSSDFQRGDFIGFYTGRWTTGRGRGDYVVEFGDDVWRVYPPQLSRSARFCRDASVYEEHAMAAINEPSAGVSSRAHSTPLTQHSQTLTRYHVCRCCFPGRGKRLLRGVFRRPTNKPAPLRRGARDGRARRQAH